MGVQATPPELQRLKRGRVKDTHYTLNIEVTGAAQRWQRHYWPLRLAVKYQQSVSPLLHSFDFEESRSNSHKVFP